MEQIAACGLVCDECSAYKASQANDPDAVLKVAQEWSKIFNSDVKPEHVWCDGCLSESTRKCAHCADCAIRACVVGRGIENCGLCDGYPCTSIAEFFQGCPEAKAKLDGIRDSRQ